MATDLMQIRSSVGTYAVTESASLHDALRAATLAIGRDGQGAFCLIDSEVARLYPEAIQQTIPASRLCRVEADERRKSLDALQEVILWLLDSGMRRDHSLLVVGGGVLQDIGCFIASVLFRGVAWEFVPTTLLAGCDSCIGSKSSINVGSYKNQIGTFCPPRRVHLVGDVMMTLPADELRSGMGEIIKLHLIAGESEFARMRHLLADVSAAEPLAHPESASRLSELTRSALRIKKRYIEEDEFDKGVRNLLNYGHTFGHAYESATGYAIPHGIAVTLGVATATFFSERLEMARQGYFDELDAFLHPWYHPFDRIILKTDPAAVVAAMGKDKKNAGNAISCILTAGAGKMRKVPLNAQTQVRPILEDFLARLANGDPA